MISFGRDKYHYDINDIISNFSKKLSNVKLGEFSYYFKHYYEKSKCTASHKPSKFTNINQFFGSIGGIAFEMYEAKINCDNGIYDYISDINVIDYIHSFLVGYKCVLGISEPITLDTSIGYIDYDNCNKYGVIDGLKFFVRTSNIFINFYKNTIKIQKCINVINIELDKLDRSLIDWKQFEKHSIPQIYKLFDEYISNENICGFI
tara:strand:+ start:148 stop:762 length:615 start_codon:yes stop_codon:yes gene_type:complete